MKNQVIEVLNREHGKKVIEYWKSKGVNTKDMGGSNTKDMESSIRYYGVIDDDFCCYPIESVKDANAEIIQLPTDSPKGENTFPRVMLVSDDAVVWNKSVAVCLRGGYAFATTIHASVEEYEESLKRGGSVPFYFWKYHKELSDGHKVSKSKIAEKFNIPLDKLEIVD